jgi:hypothetical protein
MTKLNNEICELNSDELDEVSGGWGEPIETKFLYEMGMVKLWTRLLPPSWQHPIFGR